MTCSLRCSVIGDDELDCQVAQSNQAGALQHAIGGTDHSLSNFYGYMNAARARAAVPMD
ncbi:MAG: hypothetical protein NVSMB6_04540 [Burkholderiaceae bacterium]